MNPTEFRHTPEAPVVYDSHPDQRYFTPMSGFTHPYGLMRFSNSGRAVLNIDINGDSVMGDVRVKLSADDLQALARACIDAAHDLRVNPPCLPEVEWAPT